MGKLNNLDINPIICNRWTLHVHYANLSVSIQGLDFGLQQSGKLHYYHCIIMMI